MPSLTPFATTACPTGWSCADVGAPALAGAQAFTPNAGPPAPAAASATSTSGEPALGTWLVQASGTGLTGSADQFHFAWQTLAGNGSVTTELTSLLDGAGATGTPVAATTPASSSTPKAASTSAASGASPTASTAASAAASASASPGGSSTPAASSQGVLHLSSDVARSSGSAMPSAAGTSTNAPSASATPSTAATAATATASSSAQAGVLLRQSTDPSAAFYGVFVTGQTVVVAYRDAKGDQVTTVKGSAATLPLYLKAIRKGNTFSALTSADGASWTAVPNASVKLPSFGGPALAGIGASSGNSGTLSQASFSSPLVTPGVAVAGLGELRYYTFTGNRLNDRADFQLNVASGNGVLHERDLNIAGTGLNLAVDRYYNTLGAQGAPAGDFGNGWQMGSGRDVNLVVNPDSSVQFNGPSGYEVTFTPSGSDYITPTGLDATLVKNNDGSFTLTWHKTGEKYNFSSSGVFTSDVDKNGNTIAFAYNPDGTLNTITDTQGRVVTFSYISQNGLQLISQMADSTGRVWKYSYDPTSNNLTTYTDPNNKQTTYTYNGPNGALDNMTDPERDRTNLSYEAVTPPATARVTSVQYGDGGRINITYNAGSTVVADPNANPSTYVYDSTDRVTKVSDPNGNSIQTSWNADSNVATSTDAKNQTTSFGYDSSGEKLQSVTFPTGATASWAYNDANHPFYPTSSTDTQGNSLSFPRFRGHVVFTPPWSDGECTGSEPPVV